MKPYPPTLRERRRYVVFEVKAEGRPSKDEAVKALWSALLGSLGVFGCAAAGVVLIDYDIAMQKGILRCNNKELGKVRAALALLDSVAFKPAAVYVKEVTGSMKKAK
jgi:ribonuclease P/MRP protein subunit POP5